MRLGLVISNDWELFGDGSGEYFEIQHRPLEDLLKTIENHGAKLTVMAEVGQQWAHQRICEQETWAREVVEAWESVLKETIKKKFDVQLHLHPQWLNAEYKNSAWCVDISMVPITCLEPEAMVNILKKGRQYLNDLLKPIDDSYECIAFRAGWYCMQPSEVVVRSLLKAGIICDTSVVKGIYKSGLFDYTSAYSNYLPWFVDPKDINKKNDRQMGLLEIPIYTCKEIEIPILKKIMPRKLFSLIHYDNENDRKWFSDKDKKMLERYPLYRRPFLTQVFYGNPFMEKLKRLLRNLLISRMISLDYDNISPRYFVECIQKIYTEKTIKNLKEKDITIPIVALGHIKNIHNCDNINRILDKINKELKDNIIYWTLSDSIKYWINHLKNHE